MARTWRDGGETAPRLPDVAILPRSIRNLSNQAIVVSAMIRYPAIFVVCLGKRMVTSGELLGNHPELARPGHPSAMFSD
jgi:hypothetical protein